MKKITEYLDLSNDVLKKFEDRIVEIGKAYETQEPSF